MEAVVSWNAYIQLKSSNSSVADMMDEEAIWFQKSPNHEICASLQSTVNKFLTVRWPIWTYWSLWNWCRCCCSWSTFSKSSTQRQGDEKYWWCSLWASPKVAFLCLIKVVHIALSLAISSATCERSFSALKRIKYYRRSTMTEPRLNDLAVLSIESDLSRTLDLYMLLSKSLLLWIKIIELHCPNICEYCLLFVMCITRTHGFLLSSTYIQRDNEYMAWKGSRVHLWVSKIFLMGWGWVCCRTPKRLVG